MLENHGEELLEVMFDRESYWNFDKLDIKEEERETFCKYAEEIVPTDVLDYEDYEFSN